MVSVMKKSKYIFIAIFGLFAKNSLSAAVESVSTSSDMLSVTTVGIGIPLKERGDSDSIILKKRPIPLISIMHEYKEARKGLIRAINNERKMQSVFAKIAKKQEEEEREIYKMREKIIREGGSILELFFLDERELFSQKHQKQTILEIKEKMTVLGDIKEREERKIFPLKQLLVEENRRTIEKFQ